jgi:hypothetical protein
LREIEAGVPSFGVQLSAAGADVLEANGHVTDITGTILPALYSNM